MRVRYLRSQEWGASKGDIGTIIDKTDDGRVFWVRPDNWSTARLWTTPRDVEALTND
jgi:hypothetical protein